ncbi:MAG TPA: helix-turn-helix transcriptional regulator [Bacteroidales bacterium]|nr:helix-turn-helix transcriptional regulator [Bacteroidales bacterium]HNS47051.1 helix-turn-helix transcriptional regulator [Bacteroidales bacterium]
MKYEIIKSLAREKNITLKELAQAANITEVGLQKMINNRTMRVDVLEKICSRLNIDLNDLVSLPETDTSKKYDRSDIIAMDKMNKTIAIYKQRYQEEIEYLKKLLKERQETINLLIRVLDSSKYRFETEIGTNLGPQNADFQGGAK